MKIKLFILQLLIVGLASTVNAQANDLTAAKKFLNTLQIEKNFPFFRASTSRVTTNILAAAIPEVANNQDQIIAKLNEFQEKYIRWQDLEEEYAHSVATIFTAEELDELSKFFNSSAGAKYLASSNTLTQEFGRIYKKHWDLHKDKVIKSLDEIVKKQP